VDLPTHEATKSPTLLAIGPWSYISGTVALVQWVLCMSGRNDIGLNSAKLTSAF
jgi:hypothetical protein